MTFYMVTWYLIDNFGIYFIHFWKPTFSQCLRAIFRIAHFLSLGETWVISSAGFLLISILLIML